MRVASVLGNVETDADLAAARERHRADGTLERLVLDETERRRSRFRGETDAGTTLGVVVGDDAPLVEGDVLVDDDNRFVVVSLAERGAFEIEFAPETDPLAAAAFGHAVGNRHWSFARRDGIGYVATGPDADSRQRLLEHLLPEGTKMEETTVEPSVFDAGGEVGQHTGEGHTHDGTDEHSHGVDGNHGHSTDAGDAHATEGDRD